MATKYNFENFVKDTGLSPHEAGQFILDYYYGVREMEWSESEQEVYESLVSDYKSYN